MKAFQNALRIACALLPFLYLVVCHPASAQAPKTYDVTQPPYNADKTGTVDDTAVIQQAVTDAIAYGNANGHPAVTVLLPAGTFLIAGGANQNTQINISGSTNLTFQGAGTGSTTLWYSRANSGHCFYSYGNTNFTLQNFSADVQKLPSGLYDLGETQGTITAISRTPGSSTIKLTVQVEAGYPSLSRTDLLNAPTNGYGRGLYLLADPTRQDFSDYPSLTNVAPTGSGMTGTLTLNATLGRLYAGEQWMIYTNPGGLWCDMGYGNSGTTTLQNINFYGGAVNWMGNAGINGPLTFDHLYCGPPPYQPNRHLTCLEGWQMGGRGAFRVTNSTFLRTWDDTFDVGTHVSAIVSQPASTQIIVPNGDFKANDAVEFNDYTDAPIGATYGQTTIMSVAPSGSNTLITLNQPVTVRNSTDGFTDLTASGSITAINCTFNNATQRHVYFRSATGITVQGCTFQEGTPLIMGGLGGGVGQQGPDEVHNVLVTGNTFLRSNGCIVTADGGASRAASGTNVTIANNKFIDCGRATQQDSTPLGVGNVTGVVIKNNWFERNYGANITAYYDQNLQISGNVFSHPNLIHPSDTGPNDMSLMYLRNVDGVSVSGNLLSGAGPFTKTLQNTDATVTNATGLVNGTIQIDSPLAFLLSSSQGGGH